MKKKYFIIIGGFLVILMPLKLVAEDTAAQIAELEAEVAAKVDLLNQYEQEQKDLQSKVSNLEEKKSELEIEKAELEEDVKVAEKYVKSYLKFLQKAKNTNLMLRVLSDENTLTSLYQFVQIFNFVSEEFRQLLFDINDLERKTEEYEATITELSADEEELGIKIAELEEIYEELNKELVELEKMEEFENLYDDNANISQDEQEQLMEEVGISRSDYIYVDYIITRESSWNYTATNPISGAYGLCQALPPDKMSTMGSDWRDNPVTQLKWCDSYATSRYGSWSAAQEFWKANSWW